MTVSMRSFRRPIIPEDKLTLGDPELDRLLRGGIPCGSVTELAGEATAGKTQLSLQLMLTVQWPRDLGGLEGSAWFIPTESKPYVSRLAQLAAGPLGRRCVGGGQLATRRIQVLHMADNPDALLNTLARLEVQLDSAAPKHGGITYPSAPAPSTSASSLPPRLLVLDSIAQIFRDVDPAAQTEALAARTHQLFEVARCLKRVAARHRLAVVVTNQVADVMRDTLTENQGRYMAPVSSSGRTVLPALGLAWASCVNHRLLLSRAYGPAGALVADPLPGKGATPRRLHVGFSPYVAPGSCSFLVDDEGIKADQRNIEF